MRAHALFLFSARAFTLPNQWFSALPHNHFRLGQFFMGCAMNRGGKSLALGGMYCNSSLILLQV